MLNFFYCRHFFCSILSMPFFGLSFSPVTLHPSFCRLHIHGQAQSSQSLCEPSYLWPIEYYILASSQPLDSLHVNSIGMEMLCTQLLWSLFTKVCLLCLLTVVPSIHFTCCPLAEGPGQPLTRIGPTGLLYSDHAHFPYHTPPPPPFCFIFQSYWLYLITQVAVFSQYIHWKSI